MDQKLLDSLVAVYIPIWTIKDLVEPVFPAQTAGLHSNMDD